MKEICLVFEAFLVFVFPSLTSLTVQAVHGVQQYIRALHYAFHSRLTRQMPQHELRPEPDLTLL